MFSELLDLRFTAAGEGVDSRSQYCSDRRNRDCMHRNTKLHVNRRKGWLSRICLGGSCSSCHANVSQESGPWRWFGRTNALLIRATGSQGWTLLNGVPQALHRSRRLAKHPQDWKRIADGCANHSLDAVRYGLQWYQVMRRLPENLGCFEYSQ